MRGKPSGCIIYCEGGGGVTHGVFLSIAGVMQSVHQVDALDCTTTTYTYAAKILKAFDIIIFFSMFGKRDPPYIPCTL